MRQRTNYVMTPNVRLRKESLEANKRAKISVATTKPEDDNIRSIAAAVVKGMINASQVSKDANSGSSGSTIPSRVSMPQHGTHASRQAASSSRRRTYDHLGNVIEE